MRRWTERSYRPESTKLSSVLVEIRHRLRACQFHVKFRTPLSEETLSALQVLIPNPNCVEFKAPDCYFTFDFKSAELVPNTISSLVKNQFHVSFRIHTNPDTINGSFTREILLASQNIVPSISIPSTNKEYDIYCRHCGSRCGIDVMFKRVLPLPSTSWQEVDWYCHKHDGEDKSSSRLAPSEADCFYSTGLWLLHAPTALAKATFEGKSILCHYCNYQLGVLDDETATLWNFAILWMMEDCKYNYVCDFALVHTISMNSHMFRKNIDS